MKATSFDRPTCVRVRPLALGLAAAIAAAPACAVSAPIVGSHAFPAEGTHAPWAAHPWPAAAIVPPRTAAILPVTSCGDDPDDPGTLRNVVAGAESGDTVDLSQLACSTISLENGAITINVDDLAIRGPGPDALAVQNANVDAPTSRIFYGARYGTLYISDVTIAHGFDNRRGGCIKQSGDLVLTHVTLTSCRVYSSFLNTQGGAADVRGNLTLTDSVVSSNSVSAGTYRHVWGGGLSVYGSTTISGSTISGNTAAGSYSSGGGLSVGDATITDSTISGNTASGNGAGGGLAASGNLAISGSTIDSNVSGGDGGGISSQDYRPAGIHVDIVNSTISGNSAAKGGGGVATEFRALQLQNSTVAFNTAAATGGSGVLFRNASSLTLQSALIADNTNGDGAAYAADLGMPGTVTAAGANNLVVAADGILPGDTLHDDPLLLALARNGGPTRTHALAAGSPAVDAGNNAAGLTFDQRGDGFPREVGGGPDIGAFELQSTAPPAVPPIVAKGFAPAAIFVNGTSTLTIVLTNTNATPATLSADLVDALPSGLTLADPTDADTDCPAGGVTAIAGGDTLALAAGAQLPANGTCSVTAAVTAATTGTFTNTIPAGALQTDLGDNPDPATADLDVSIETHMVAPGAGEGGAIQPDAPQAVADGDRIEFTLTPGPGRHVGAVGGTCGGTLAGTVFTTDPVTDDCTVEARFSSDVESYLKFAPVSVPTPGSRHQDGPGIHLLVAAQDSGEPGKRIFLSSIEDDAGLYGFDGRTGASLPGFAPAALPTADRGGVVYPLAIATTLASGAPGYDILAAHYRGALRLFDAGGDVVWDHGAANYVAVPGSSYGLVGADAAQDARFVVDEENFTVFGRSGRSGEVIWHGNGTAQRFATPAVVDPGTPDAAFVFGSGNGNGECDVQRMRVDSGATVWSDHLLCYGTTFVAASDVDGVPGDEVVAVLESDSDPSIAIVSVLDAGSGVLKWAYPLAEASLSGTAPALADLDGDGAAEIVVQTETMLHVLKYGVGELAGWPALLCDDCRMGNSAPVVGDLDGDPELEIAVVTQQAGSDQTGYLHVFGQNGERKLFDGPVQMPIGAGRAPAIADVDGDGHNELLVGGVAASNPSLYVLDFSLGDAAVRHGPVPWGQFGADAQHRNRPASTAPTLAKGFAPANVATGQPSVLTLTLGNVRVAPAALEADLVDLLPAGLVIADPPNASTDCPDGNVGAAPGEGALTLAAGTRIPALGTCTVTAAVVAEDEGVYTNMIPAAALRTDLGSNADPASAVLVVQRGQVPDRLFADGFDGGGGLCVPQQLLADPGFESTDPIAFANPFWSVFSATFGTPLCNEIACGNGGGSAYPRSGAFWSWFGGIDHTAESAGVAQTVTIPAGAPRFVNFWLFVGTVGGAGAALDVTVDGGTVGSFPEPAIPDGDYVARSVDVSAFADGAAHAIGFAYAQSANGGTTNYSLDDVTLDCQPASSSPRTSHAAPASPNRRRR